MKINEKHARGISTEATFVQAALAADLPTIEACMSDLPIYEIADLARTPALQCAISRVLTYTPPAVAAAMAAKLRGGGDEFDQNECEAPAAAAKMVFLFGLSALRKATEEMRATDMFSHLIALTGGSIPDRECGIALTTVLEEIAVRVGAREKEEAARYPDAECEITYRTPLASGFMRWSVNDIPHLLIASLVEVLEDEPDYVDAAKYLFFAAFFHCSWPTWRTLVPFGCRHPETLNEQLGRAKRSMSEGAFNHYSTIARFSAVGAQSAAAGNDRN